MPSMEVTGAPSWPGSGMRSRPGSWRGSSLRTDVTKIRSPQTMGELQPWPGIPTFQTTFSVRLQVSGSAGSSATAPAFAPLNRGQLSPALVVWPDAAEAAASRTRQALAAASRHRLRRPVKCNCTNASCKGNEVLVS